jgi:hypothetical protein
MAECDCVPAGRAYRITSGGEIFEHATLVGTEALGYSQPPESRFMHYMPTWTAFRFEPRIER